MLRSELKFWISLLAVATIQSVVLLSLITHKSFTMDEVYELRHLSTNLWEIAQDGDGFPPTFRWLLSLQIAWTGEYYARAISAMTSILGTIVVGMAGRELTSAKGGFGSALFFAFSACQMEYAQQCRAYSLYVLACALATFAFARVVNNCSRMNWGLFVLASFFCWISHYYSLFYLAFLWLGAFYFECGSAATTEERMKSLWRVIAWGSLLIGFTFPTLLWFWVDWSKPGPPEVINPVDLTAVAYTYLTFAQGWCLGPSSIELLELGLIEGLKAMAPWAFVSLGVATILIRLVWNRSNVRMRLLIVTLICVPIIAALVSALLEVSFVSRYLACLVVPVSLVVGASMDSIRKRIEYLLVAVLLLINLISFYQRNWSDRYNREDYCALARYIESQDSNPTVVILSSYLGHAALREMPSNWQIQLQGFYSDEPNHDDLQAASFTRTPGAWIVTEWYVQGSDLQERRDRFLKSVKAQNVARIAHTIELFRVP